jgi:hypothetical protein
MAVFPFTLSQDMVSSSESGTAYDCTAAAADRLGRFRPLVEDLAGTFKQEVDGSVMLIASPFIWSFNGRSSAER